MDGEEKIMVIQKYVCEGNDGNRETERERRKRRRVKGRKRWREIAVREHSKIHKTPQSMAISNISSNEERLRAAIHCGLVDVNQTKYNKSPVLV